MGSATNPLHQGQVICFSGCDDHQTSADQSELSNGTSTGAMTFSLIAAAEANHTTTYSILFDDIYETLKGEDSESTGIDNKVQTAMLAAGAAATALAAKVLGQTKSRQLLYKFNKLKRSFLGGASGGSYNSPLQMYMNYTTSCSSKSSGPYFSQEPQISANSVLDLNMPFSL